MRSSAAREGWMSEWFKVPVLKTGALQECRGFESLSIRLNFLCSSSTRGQSGPSGPEGGLFPQPVVCGLGGLTAAGAPGAKRRVFDPPSGASGDRQTTI